SQAAPPSPWWLAKGESREFSGQPKRVPPEIALNTLPSSQIPGRQSVQTRPVWKRPAPLPVFPDLARSFQPEVSSFRLRCPFAEGMENHGAADGKASHCAEGHRLH